MATRRLHSAAVLKQLAVRTGLYRPARWAERLVRGTAAQHRAEQALYRSIIPPGALCFDVGANIGEKSEAMLAADARVVAFEPNPAVWPELEARCGDRPRWTLVRAAVGARSAVLDLHTRVSSGQSSMIAEWEGVPLGSCPVPVITLDAAIERFGVPYYCKIDVEGWEEQVLRGLSHAIPLLSFEFHLSAADISKTRACLNHLRAFGQAEVAIAPAETPSFLTGHWVSLASFVDWFPGNLQETLPGSGYGDVFVRLLSYLTGS